MKKIRVWNFMKVDNIVFFIPILIILLSTPAHVKFGADIDGISFRKISEKADCNSDNECISLGEQYKYINYIEKESRNLFINTGDGIDITKDSILSITIEDLPFSKSNFLAHAVTINVDDSTRNLLSAYLNGASKDTFAVITDKHVFTLAQIVTIRENKFHLTVYGRTKLQIKEELSHLSEKIVIMKGIPGIDY